MAVALGLLPIVLGSGATPSGELSGPPVPQPGYHHLGATTDGGWSGVLGRLTVDDPGVRAGTFDFVATRFMAKASTATGVKWLELRSLLPNREMHCSNVWIWHFPAVPTAPTNVRSWG